MTTQSPVRPGVLPLADGSFAVASSSPANPPYLVTRDGATLRCTCKAYAFSREDPRTCKHCAAVRDELRAHRALAVRYCEACNLTPVTDGMAVCPDCAARSIAGAERAIARWAYINLDAEQARVDAANARADAIFAGEVR